MNARRRNHDGEDGFTLIELLVTIVIAGIIIGALANALFVGIKGTTDNRTSLDQSNSAQNISTYLTKDVQEAAEITFSPAATCGGEPAVVQLRSRSAPLAAIDTTVTYALVGTNLLRCLNAPSGLAIADNISVFSQGPCSQCGPQAVEFLTTANASATVGPYSWSLRVNRRAA